jgi:hypothetical protein
MRYFLFLSLVAALALVGPGAGVSASEAQQLCVGRAAGCLATLQSALAAAQDGDTITLAAGTYAGGVTIDKSIRLVGAGAGETTISGGGPVLTIGSKTLAPTVSISSLTVSGGTTTTNPQSPNCGPDVPRCGPGYATATALGGGIEAFQGTHVTVSHSVVTGNTATPPLSVASVKATCPGDVPCRASFGDAAGIDDWGTMTLDDTTVSDNHASGAQSDGGGIVDEAGASLLLRNSTVTGNSASAPAPTGRFASGGGIFVDTGATLAIDGSSVSGNRASLANSFPHPYPEQDGNSDLANAFAAGIFLSDGASATISHSHLDHNGVTVDGPTGEPFGADAAICACGNSPLTLDHDTLDGNTVTVNVLSTTDSGPSGFSALEADGDIAIDHTRFSGNAITVSATAGDAAAIGAVGLLFGGSTLATVSHTKISDNVAAASAPAGDATAQGAGLLTNEGLVLDHDRISGNRATANGLTGAVQGAGIWNGSFFGGNPSSPLLLSHSTVTGNTLIGSASATIQGAGLYTPGYPSMLDQSTIAGNTPDQCYGC